MARETYAQRQTNLRGYIREWRRRGCDDDFPDGGATSQFIDAAWEWAYPGLSTTSYAFDAFANRTSMTKPGNQTTTYAYDDADRLTSVTPPGQSAISYTSDDNGNLTDRGDDEFAWDFEDRMTSATVDSVSTTFAYRGDGLRHSRTTGGNTTVFTWDVNAGLPVVIDDEDARYVYGAGLVSQVRGGEPSDHPVERAGSMTATARALTW